MTRLNRFAVIAVGVLSFWLLLLALLPFALVLVASFLHQGTTGFLKWDFTWHNYFALLNPIYINVFLRSLSVAMITTVLCLLFAYPFAFILARLPERLRLLGLFLIIIPFWTSSLIRSYAIITLIKTHGLLNEFLLWLGVIDKPLHLLYTPLTSQIGLVYSLLPFMVLPLYATLEKFDWRLVEAARDLGASKQRAFWRIVVPVSLPGILAGCLLVLLPAMTLFYIPEILGGAKSILLGNLIKAQFLEAENWPLGAAVSVMLTILMLLLMTGYKLVTRHKEQVML